MRSKVLAALNLKEKNGTINEEEQESLNNEMGRIFELNEFNNRQLDMIKKTGWVKPLDADIRTARLSNDH